MRVGLARTSRCPVVRRDHHQPADETEQKRREEECSIAHALLRRRRAAHRGWHGGGEDGHEHCTREIGHAYRREEQIGFKLVPLKPIAHQGGGESLLNRKAIEVDQEEGVERPNAEQACLLTATAARPRWRLAGVLADVRAADAPPSPPLPPPKAGRAISRNPAKSQGTLSC